MSLVNVTAAPAPFCGALMGFAETIASVTAAAAIVAPMLRERCSRTIESLLGSAAPRGPLALGLHRDLQEPVAPTTLRVTGIRESGRVVRAHADDVLARLAEGRTRRRLSAGVANAPDRRRKRHEARTLMLEPGDGERRAAAAGR